MTLLEQADGGVGASYLDEVARAFRISRRRADEIIAEVVNVVRGWRDEAERAQLPRAEQERMSPAFRLVE